MLQHFTHAHTPRIARTIVSILFASVCVLLMGMATARTAMANTITVNSTSDAVNSADGLCTLREAITQANADTGPVGPAGECGGASGEDTIVFSVSGAITLTATLPAIADHLTIDGAANGANITVSGNNAVLVMSVSSGVRVTIDSLTITEGRNIAGFGGGINSEGTLTVTNSTLSKNHASSGGGIVNGGPMLTVFNSTFYSNTSNEHGGGVDSFGGLNVINSTFISNSAVGAGGAIRSSSAFTLTNSTVTGNSANIYGGLSSNAAVTLRNTIVAGNSGGDCIVSSVTADAYNLDSDGSCGDATTRTLGQINLQPLGNNGGKTRTMALGAGSAALNAGNNAVCPSTDQRGVARPQAGACDAGAFELEMSGACAAMVGSGPGYFQSANAQAVRDAIAAAAAGNTVKVAGYCAGAVAQGGATQVTLITKTLTLQGGYTLTNWTTSYPVTQPTTLDALGGGRGMNINGAPVSLSDLTVQNGIALESDGGDILSNRALTLTNVSVLSGTTDSDGGGVSTSSSLVVVNSRIISNTAGQSAGGARAGGTLTLIGGLFERNVSQHGGGARAFGSAVMTGTQFINNRSSPSGFSGGGLKADGASTLNGGLFQGNSGYDGAGFSSAAAASISGTAFISNTAARFGGGTNVSAPLYITAATFISNTSSVHCGALRTPNVLVASASNFYTNTTQGNGGGVCADAGATVSGGQFQNNTAGNGGGLWSGSSTSLLGATFISNTATGNGGGGVLIESGVLTLTGATFVGNAALAQNGGGVLVSGTMVMSGTALYTNTSATDGGGAYVVGASTLTNGRFQGNRCTGGSCFGGGLRALGTVSASDTPFVGNQSIFAGGGIEAGGAVTLTGGGFYANRSVVGGGGGLRAGGQLNVVGSEFVQNTSAAIGGGAFGQSNVTLVGARFRGNQTGGSFGGGGMATFGFAVMSDTVFYTNTSTHGGGAYTFNGARLSGAVFVGNGASGNAGGLRVANGSLHIVNSLFAGNEAGADGEAIVFEAPGGTAHILHTTIASPTQAGGAAVHVTNGTVGITNTIIASHTVGISRTGGTVNENYSLFFGNGANTAGGVLGGVGSLTGDPRFVSPALGDYRLGPLSAALNTGVNAGVATDFEAQARPQGGGFDIGYDEAPWRTVFVPSAQRDAVNGW